MSEFNRENIRKLAYSLSGRGELSIGRIVPGYCCKEEFDGIFTEKELELLYKSSSINEDASNIKNLKTNLIITKCYPENTFLNDVGKILSCNRKKLASERLNPDYVHRRCLEIMKTYYENEINKVENGAGIKKADFLKKKAEIQGQLEASGT